MTGLEHLKLQNQAQMQMIHIKYLGQNITVIIANRSQKYNLRQTPKFHVGNYKLTQRTWYTIGQEITNCNIKTYFYVVKDKPRQKFTNTRAHTSVTLNTGTQPNLERVKPDVKDSESLG